VRTIRDVLRVKILGITNHKHFEFTGNCSFAVDDYLRRATAARLIMQLPVGLDATAMEAMLFTNPVSLTRKRKSWPDYVLIYVEIRMKGALLFVVHEESPGNNSDAVGYSTFCLKYCRTRKTEIVEARR